MRMRLTLAGRPPAWTAANVQGYIANERPKGVSKTQSAWTEGFVKWMLREPSFSGGKIAPSAEADAAWQEFRQASREGRRPAKWAHENTEAALEAIGGWAWTRSAESRAIDFKEREFKAAFQSPVRAV